MSKKPTHIGIIRGCDARTPSDFKKWVRVRETKLYWITEHGTRYSKKWNGSGTGDWPLYRLMLDTIKPLPQSSSGLEE